MKQETGFTLIEVVASLVIVGILAVFSSLFLLVGLEGYEFTRKAAAAAMDAEVALNRLSLELKTISTIPSAPDTNSLSYTSSDETLASTARMIKFASDNLYLNVYGSDYVLIKDVSNPVLSVEDDLDLDGDGKNEVAYITVGFTLGNMPPFQTRVYPRNMVDASYLP